MSNSAVNNGPYSGIGIYSDIDRAHPRSTPGVSSGNVIENNVVADNIQARRPANVVNTDNIGIRIEPSSSGNSILGNQVTGNGLDGITLSVRASGNTVRFNQVSGNGYHRQTARRGNAIGIQIGGANDNVVEYNHVTRNADNGVVIRNGSQRNTVRFNNVVGNTVFPPASNTFGPTFDILDNNPACDANVWRGNQFQTAFPACVTG